MIPNLFMDSFHMLIQFTPQLERFPTWLADMIPNLFMDYFDMFYHITFIRESLSTLLADMVLNLFMDTFNMFSNHGLPFANEGASIT